ncbi:hypothetical protein UlMin_012734 [Ulmus minor]
MGGSLSAERKRGVGIPVGYLEHEDTLIWHHTRDGEYSVKSGYKTALSLDDMAECSNPQAVNKWWKSLWNLKIPPKIRNFTWRLYVFVVVLVENLFFILFGSVLRLNFFGRLHVFMVFLRDFCLFLTYIWQIWNMRNKALHKERYLLPDNLVLISDCLLEDYLKYNEAGLYKRVVSAPPSCWIPPIRNCFQVNVDVAIDKNSGACGFGLIIRDDLGCVLDVRWKFWAFPIGVEAAELLAIRE